MAEAILVLNAGSSSLKFCVFLGGEPPAPLLRGQLEGLFTQPHFVARDHGGVAGEKTWAAGTRLGHDGAFEATLYARRITGSTVYVDAGLNIMA